MVLNASHLENERCDFVCFFLLLFFFVAFLHGKPFVQGHNRKHYIQMKRCNFNRITTFIFSSVFYWTDYPQIKRFYLSQIACRLDKVRDNAGMPEKKIIWTISPHLHSNLKRFLALVSAFRWFIISSYVLQIH